MAILGIDEVGRGPLAGPLVVGAVILPEKDGEWPEWVGELKDSKKLSARRRERLAEIIWREAVVALGWVKTDELNEVGLAEGMRRAVRRAVEAIQKQKKAFTEIVIDGNVNYLSGTAMAQYTTTVVKGDDLIKEVSAASIIAKVTRDRYMIKLADTYPDYGFERHMGYGTKQHLGAILKYGICDEHRLFCAPVARAAGVARPVFERAVKNTTEIGVRGEEAVCKYLAEREGHQIVSRNFKTRSCEIDVVSVKGDELFFTEVKTRGDESGLMAINAEKKQRMRRAAVIFLDRHLEYRTHNPKLAVAAVNGDFEVVDWFSLDAFDV